MPTIEPHQAREVAESFGIDPGRYDRARPRYPDAMVAAIVSATPGPDLVDVGMGTGIVARQFQSAGCRVLGVEVDERMADWTRQRGLDVEVAAFEGWDPAGRTFDAVVSGQSWHWVDPVAGAVKAAEALRPGGRLAVFWNVQQPPPDLGAAFMEVFRPFVPDALISRVAASTGVEIYSAMCDKAADGIRRAGAFTEPEQWRFDWERVYTRHEWLDLLPTTGGLTRLPPEPLAEVLAGVGAVIDDAGGSFPMSYATVVVTSARGA